MSDVKAITKERDGLDPEVARAVGLVLRMMHDRSYGSVTVEIRHGRVSHIEERRTYKPQEAVDP